MAGEVEPKREVCKCWWEGGDGQLLNRQREGGRGEEVKLSVKVIIKCKLLKIVR